MIEKIQYEGPLGWKDVAYQVEDLTSKVNEIIDAMQGEEARMLVCPHCGSDVWRDWHESTLMGGRMNIYTYTCMKCKERTRVRRYKQPRDHHVYLGPEDEIKE